MVALVPLLYIVQAAGSCLTVNKLNLPRSKQPTNQWGAYFPARPNMENADRWKSRHGNAESQTWKKQILDGNIKVQQ